MNEDICLALQPVDLSAQKMKAEGIEDVIVEMFSRYHQQIAAGVEGYLREEELDPVVETQVVAHDELGGFEGFGRNNLHKAVRIILNGGLGTTMGLPPPSPW